MKPGVFTFVATVALGACAGPVETELGELSRAAVVVNGLSANGLSANGLSANGLSANGLSANQLSPGAFELIDDAEIMAETPQGREVLAYLIRCAFPAGTTMYARTAEQLYAFTGQLGLAPEWRDRALPLEGQQWVSACMLAHANALGEHVPVSLRGDHPGLAVGLVEAAVFTVEEGAFYGNIFAETPHLVSCVGVDGGDDEASPYMAQRVCATDVTDGETACGFASAGACFSGGTCYDEPDVDTEGYGHCRLGSNGRSPAVITVYLAAELQ